VKVKKNLAKLVEFTIEKKKIQDFPHFFVKKWQNFTRNYSDTLRFTVCNLDSHGGLPWVL
jgi:hypothetical protein